MNEINAKTLTLGQIKDMFPMPWNMAMGQNPAGMGGQMFIFDQNRREIPLFVMARYLEISTSNLAEKTAAKEHKS